MAEPASRGSMWKLQRPSLDAEAGDILQKGNINAPPTARKNEFTSSRALLANFCLMAFAFSANHGTVVSLVGIAGAVLQPAQNGAIQASLYSSYTLASLLFANWFITKLGSKGTILLGLSMYCFYSGAFLVSKFLAHGSTIQWVVVIGATILSGVGAGGLWTAQASFFASTAKQHVRITGCSIESANAYFSSVFVVFYLGFEVALRIVSSLVDPEKNAITLYIIYTGVAVGSAFLMSFVRPVQQIDESVQRQPIFKKITAAGRIAISDPRVMLLAPYNFTFSIASAFLNSYVATQSTYECVYEGNITNPCTEKNAPSSDFWNNRTIVHQGADIIPAHWIGWFTSLLAVSALIFSTMSGFIVKHTTIPKVVPMVLGSLLFIGFSLFFVLNPGQHGNATMHGKYEYLIPLYIMFGCGRGVWEGTMKAVFADYFGDSPETSAAAFANIPLQNGFSGAMGFILFTNVQSPRTLGMWMVLGIGVTGIVTYLMSNRINSSMAKRRETADSESRPLLSGASKEDTIAEE